jgi:hypothetical protein
MLHACVERFDVMGERENILGWVGEVNKALVDVPETGFSVASLDAAVSL